jgi:signal transduction histidine kinase
VAPAGWPLPVIVIGALAAVVIAAWSLGRFRRVRADYVLALAERARRAEADRQARALQAAAEERGRIAREMHDVVSHSLAVMVAQAEAGRMAAVKDPARGIAVLPIIAGTGREAMADMRSLLGVLRSAPEDPQSADPGMSNTPQPGLLDIPALLRSMAAAGLRVEVAERGKQIELGGIGELTAYRLVQEALTNVIKHAGPTASVVVDLHWESTELIITVTDAGGAQETERVAGSGQGLVGMRERVTAIGGRWSAGPADGGGFRVSAAIPLFRVPAVAPQSAGTR